MYIETICVTFYSLKLTYVKLPYKFTSQICPKKAFRIPTHCHPLETFPESVSQSFLHGISDIRHLILVNVYIVRFDKFLKKKNDENPQMRNVSKIFKKKYNTCK